MVIMGTYACQPAAMHRNVAGGSHGSHRCPLFKREKCVIVTIPTVLSTNSRKIVFKTRCAVLKTASFFYLQSSPCLRSVGKDRTILTLNRQKLPPPFKLMVTSLALFNYIDSTNSLALKRKSRNARCKESYLDEQ